ncbi:Hypothetical_protein [Hexamita inflata]|uniref:Hypothetical_protein n=1 Tax=Hexamita inflata TaxID=28002 RepID=A0AA86R4L2_9EUKA|nr:Hypothetical protein HINF_LOCUS59106 [Hexamita inflata]
MKSTLDNCGLRQQSSAKITLSIHPFQYSTKKLEVSNSQYSSHSSYGSSYQDDKIIKQENDIVTNTNGNDDVVLYCFYLNFVNVSEIVSKVIYVYKTNSMQISDEILQVLNIIRQGICTTHLSYLTSICAYDSVYWLNLAKPQINSVLTRFFGNTKRPSNHPIYKLLNQSYPKALIDRFSIMKQIRDYMIKTWLIFHSDSKTKTEYRHIFNIDKLINGLPELNWERQFLQHNGKHKTEYDYIPVRMLNPQQAFILLQNDYLHQGILLLAIAPLFIGLGTGLDSNSESDITYQVMMLHLSVYSFYFCILLHQKYSQKQFEFINVFKQAGKEIVIKQAFSIEKLEQIILFCVYLFSETSQNQITTLSSFSIQQNYNLNEMLRKCQQCPDLSINDVIRNSLMCTYLEQQSNSQVWLDGQPSLQRSIDIKGQVIVDQQAQDEMFNLAQQTIKIIFNENVELSDEEQLKSQLLDMLTNLNLEFFIPLPLYRGSAKSQRKINNKDM